MSAPADVAPPPPPPPPTSSSSSTSRHSRSRSRSPRRSRPDRDRSDRSEHDYDRERERDRSSRSRRHRSRSRSKSPRHRSRERDHRRSSHRRSSRSPSHSRSRSRSRERSSRKRRSAWDVADPAAAGSVTPVAPVPPHQAQQNLMALAAQQQLLANLQRGVVGVGANLGTSTSGAVAKAQRQSRIYIGSIFYDVTPVQIRELFGIFGTIVELEMPTDAATGKHKGFVFLEYTDVASATRAIIECNGKTIWGRQIKVNRPSDGQNAQAAANALSQGGGAAAGFPGLTGLTTTNVSGQTPAPLSAEALAQLQARLGSTPSSAGGGSTNQNTPRRIYVGNLTFDLTAEHVKQLFLPFGPIRSVEMILDRETQKPKGFAFVEFETERSALEAIVSMQDFDCCGRALRVNSASAHGTSTTPNTQGIQPNLAAVQQARMAALILASAGVGVGLSAAGHTSYENDGYINSATQRRALMEKLAGRDTATAPIESQVILLKNLVGPGEVDAELEDEVREEASQFGVVNKVVIHETKLQVLIYVLFDNTLSASKARQSLDKRFFGGRLTLATFYPKQKFDAGRFEDS